MRGGLLTKMDEQILAAMHRYRYMTAEDVAYALFTPGALSNVRAALARLSGGDFAEGQYLYRFLLPDTKKGNPRRVYTLGRRGRTYAKHVLGLPTDWYFNPERTEYAGFLHLQHSLALTKVLIAAQRWSGKQDEYTLAEARTSYELSRLRDLKEAALSIPDCWLLFTREGKKHPLLLEIDLGTEHTLKFKQHIAARIEFVQSGKYEAVFGVPAVMIAYLAIADISRRKIMAKWAEEVCKELNLAQWGKIFKFGVIDPSEIYNLMLFTQNIWQQPYRENPVPLFD